MKKIISVLLIHLASLTGVSQDLSRLDLSRFEIIDRSATYFRVTKPAECNEQAIFSEVKNLFLFGPLDEYELFKVVTDELKLEHKIFEQVHNKIKVRGGGLTIHFNKYGHPATFNGRFYTRFDSAPIGITPETAISNAINASGAHSPFKWEVAAFEERLKGERQDENATYYPQSELLYMMDPEQQMAVAVYMIAIHTVEDSKSEYLYIKATDGSVWRRHPMLLSCHPSTDLSDCTGSDSICEPTDSQISKAPETKFRDTKFDQKQQFKTGLSSKMGGDCNTHCHAGSGDTEFYGNQNINVGKSSVYQDGCEFNAVDCWYRLYEECSAPFILTRFINGTARDNIVCSSTNFEECEYRYCMDRVIDGTGATGARIQIHWGMEKTVEFFKDPNRMNRVGMDGAGSTVCSNTDDPTTSNLDNAFFDPTNDEVIFGKKGPFGVHFPVSLDIVAHEFSHGVSKYSIPGGFAFGNFGNDAGSLNESFCDIFGKMTESYAKTTYNTGVAYTYITGDDCFNNNTFVMSIQTAPNVFTNVQKRIKRDMGAPNNTFNPHTHGGNNWIIPFMNTGSAGDFGGVHNNAQIQNHWFFLLAEGGSGQNDNSDNFCVVGIGKDNATRIAYHALTTGGLFNSSTFNDSRVATIQSAVLIFGANSPEVAQCTQAWYAVGVGSAYNGMIDVANHTEVNTKNHSHNCAINVFNYTVAAPGGNVTIQSNTEVILSSGFKADNGSIFRAHIAPTCNGFAARSSNTNSNPDLETEKGESMVISDKTSSIKSGGSLHVSPNPFTSEFMVSFDTAEEFPNRISLIDVTGEVIETRSNINSYELSFDLSAYSNGMYLLIVEYEQSTITKRVVKTF